MLESGAFPPTPREAAMTEVEVLESNLDSYMRNQIRQVSGAVALVSAVNSGEALADFDGLYHELLMVLYSQRGYEPVFVVDSELTDEGEEAYEILSNAWRHAMRPSHYGIRLADGIIDASEEAIVLWEEFETTSLTTEERENLVDWLVERPELLEQEDSGLIQRALFEEAVVSNGDSLVPRVNLVYQDLLDAALVLEQGAVELELVLAAGVLRYAYDMRYFNSFWFDEETAEDEDLLAQAQEEALLAVFAAGVADGFESVLEALQPPADQYGRLLEAYQRYIEIVENGGWPEIENVDIRSGRSYDVVVDLRRRLSIEGYFDGDLTDREYTLDLVDAVIAYQIAHQFRDSGRLSEGVVDSLNTPADQRMRQIALSLQRWRESGITDDETFFFVNVPDFHTEVWRDGERDMRIRTIVGSTQRVTSRETGITRYARATPEVHRTLRYVVFNPYWNVPPNIMMNEYDPNLDDNPFWYEENGFEVMYSENGTRWVRQVPGPGNALGVVKFLFPNPHDVYLHDTPSRHLFDRPMRAFSHGCMRIQNPMDLAYYLLEHDRGWEPERIDTEYRAEGTERWVTLRNPIPVHVEYYVVRVDDTGYTHFFSDLYRRDEPRLEQNLLDDYEIAIDDASWSIGTSIDEATSVAEWATVTGMIEGPEQAANEAQVE